MSVYIGLIVLDTIKNRTRFNETMNEIKHFLQTYQEELIFDITKPLINIKPKFGGAEASFSTNNNYFHTTYFRISADNKPSEDIKLFSYVVWECCCIFKENFPSKIEIFQENLDSIASFMKNFSYDEILRRQISTLNSKKYSNDPIKQDEVEDIFCILDSALKRKNTKGISVCLNILNSPALCPAQSLANLPERYIKAVELISATTNFQHDYDLDDDKSYKEVEINRVAASNLLNKILGASHAVHEEGQTSIHQTPLKDVGNLEPATSNFEKPFSVKTCLFQLNESNDINRIVFLLDNIINSYFTKILQSYSYNLFSIINKIIHRYSNGDFGFDNNDNTKYCLLQNRLLRCLLALIESKPELLFEINTETISLLSQIMEECCLYIIQNLSNYDKKYEYEYKLFFQQSLKLFELLISNHQINNIEEVINSVKSIIERVKMYFVSYPTEEDLDLEELSIFYNDLKSYYEEIKGLLIKTKTLADIVHSTAKKSNARPSRIKENI